MANEERIDILLAKWEQDSNEYRSAARRLELVDRNRHATPITMLKAGAQAIDKCAIEAQLLCRRFL